MGGKVEGHLRAVNAGPAALPPIDFAAYSKVTVPGMVDSFQAKYAALDIPYPGDQGSLAAFDAQSVEQKAAFEAFVAEGNAAIAATQVELAKFEAIKPFEDMNA